MRRDLDVKEIRKSLRHNVVDVLQHIDAEGLVIRGMLKGRDGENESRSSDKKSLFDYRGYGPVEGLPKEHFHCAMVLNAVKKSSMGAV